MTVNRFNPNGLPPYVGVSHVVIAGNYVFISGQVGSDRDGNVPASLEDQLDLTYRNLEVACNAAGLGLRNIVKTTTYITDASAFAAVAKARHEQYGEDAPANATIITALAKPEWHVEIEGIAYTEN